jgi:hypothetical protein
MARLRRSERHDCRIGHEAEARRTGTDGVGHKRRRKVSVVALNHPRVRVAKVLRHDQEGRPIHHRVTCPGVSQAMK